MIKLQSHPTIPYIDGDGIGLEIMDATRAVLDAAVYKAYENQRKIIWTRTMAGSQAKEEMGAYLPAETLALIRQHKVAIKGPLTTPIAGGYQSLNVSMRKALDLYACIRPVCWFEGLPSPLKNPKNIDIVIFRENTEDIYAGLEFEASSRENKEFLAYLKQAFPEQYQLIPFKQNVGLDIKPISQAGSERIMKAAIRWALQNERKKITLVHKGNIMKYTEGAFCNWCYATAEKEFKNHVFTQHEFQRISKSKGLSFAEKEHNKAMQAGKHYIDDMLADVAFERAISQPQNFDIIVTTNLNGDYLSDAFAALVGGIGISPGGNINFENNMAIFEANHGSAETIAGKDVANPSSLILSGEMLLRFIGWDEAADLVRYGVMQTIQKRQVTFDLHRQLEDAQLLGTQAFSQKIIENMQE